MGRNNIILPLIKNKIVLDIGFLGEDTSKKFSNLHLIIQNNAKEVWGLDIDKKRIKNLLKKGYNVIYDDVLKLNNLKKLNKKFDVIVAGELIEHLENPGLFLDKIRPFLKKKDY